MFKKLVWLSLSSLNLRVIVPSRVYVGAPTPSHFDSEWLKLDQKKATGSWLSKGLDYL